MNIELLFKINQNILGVINNTITKYIHLNMVQKMFKKCLIIK